MFNSVVLRVTGVIVNRTKLTSLRRLYVDDWSSKATDMLAQELEAIFAKWQDENVPGVVLRGQISIEVGIGKPEEVIKHYRKEMEINAKTVTFENDNDVKGKDPQQF